MNKQWIVVENDPDAPRDWAHGIYERARMTNGVFSNMPIGFVGCLSHAHEIADLMNAKIKATGE